MFPISALIAVVAYVVYINTKAITSNATVYREREVVPEMVCEDVYIPTFDVSGGVRMMVCIKKNESLFGRDHHCYISFIEDDPMFMSCVSN